MVTIEQIKSLREKTGVSVAICREALISAGGDETKALASLKESGAKMVEKKSGRRLGSGTVTSYVHSNRLLGAMLELMSETDFVAKNEDFRLLAEDLAMQVVATAPEATKDLLEQPFIKDPVKTVADLIRDSIQKFGERIEIGRFVRFDLAND